MGARDKSRFTTKQAGWIAMGIFAAWLAFLLVPTPRKAKPPASTGLPPMAAQSKLEEAGLANNPDWQGLPGFFAVWADSLAWRDDKVLFAYWNPGSQTYSYFFEAIRRKDGYRFRSITLRELETHSADYFLGDDGVSFSAAAEQKTRSSNDPFIFFSPIQIPSTAPLAGKGIFREPTVEKLDVHLEAEPLKAPSPPAKKIDDPSK